MEIPSFFSRRMPKKYDYRPIYYSAEKERMEQRLKNIESKDEQSISIQKGFLRNFTKSKNLQRKQVSNIRLFILIALLILFAWFLLFK